MSSTYLKPTILALMILALQGCSSGGSSSTPYSGTLGGATSLSTLQPSSSLNGTAIGTGLTYSGLAVDAGDNVQYPTVSNPIGPTSTPIAVITDSGGSIASIRLPELSTSTPYQYDNPSASPAPYFPGSAASVTTYTDTTGNNHVNAVTAYSGTDFNYQFYGEWNVETSSTSGFDGFFSAGVAATSLPATGTAIYAGQSIGKYIDASNNVYATSATMNATADFGNRTLDFATTGTVYDQVNVTAAPPSSANSNLDISGSLAISGVGFSGTVNMATGSSLTMTGTALGNFYGTGPGTPVTAPLEIGGTYQLSGAGGKLIGGFGGKLQ